MGQFIRLDRLASKLGRVLTNIVGSLFRGVDKGWFTVKHGTHEITVPLNVCPKKIWVSIVDDRIDGCGQSPINYIGYRLFGDQVIFYITVNSEQCKVSWFANEARGDREYWDRLNERFDKDDE